MPTATGSLRILVYSDDRNVRDRVILALGRRPAPELPAVEVVQCATEPVVIATMDDGDVDLVILDGEAVPAGGMGICRQLKNEIYNCPPIIVLTGRAQDAWLASWSLADVAITHPVDPVTFPDVVAAALRRRVGALPAR